jgi:hypothetical protein
MTSDGGRGGEPNAQDASDDHGLREPTEAQGVLLVALSASAKSALSGLRGKHSATCRGKALPDVISADCALVRREILRLAATNQL